MHVFGCLPHRITFVMLAFLSPNAKLCKHNLFLAFFLSERLSWETAEEACCDTIGLCRDLNSKSKICGHLCNIYWNPLLNNSSRETYDWFKMFSTGAVYMPMLTLNFTFCPWNPGLCTALKYCKIILMSHFMTCSVFHLFLHQCDLLL